MWFQIMEWRIEKVDNGVIIAEKMNKIFFFFFCESRVGGRVSHLYCLVSFHLYYTNQFAILLYPEIFNGNSPKLYWFVLVLKKFMQNSVLIVWINTTCLLFFFPCFTCKKIFFKTANWSLCSILWHKWALPCWLLAG